MTLQRKEKVRSVLLFPLCRIKLGNSEKKGDTSKNLCEKN